MSYGPIYDLTKPSGKRSTVWDKMAGIDNGGKRYTVVCEDHGALMGSRSQRDAMLMANNTTNFCDDCRDEMHKTARGEMN